MAIPLIAYGAVAAFQIFSGRNQSDAILGASALQNKIGELNAQYTEIDAWEAEKFGLTQAARYKNVITQTVGKQKVAFAAANVDVNSGTAKAIQDESRLAGFLNVLDIQKAGREKANGLKIQASNIRLGNDINRIQAGANASAAQTQGLIGAAGTALKGYSVLGDVDAKADAGSGGFETFDEYEGSALGTRDVSGFA